MGEQARRTGSVEVASLAVGAPWAAAGARQRCKVLLIDDAPAAGAGLTTYLEQGGLDVERAPSLVAARQVLRRQVTDLVVLVLAGADEPQLLFVNELEADEVPVIVVAGAADRERRIAYFRAGVTDFVMEPFEAEELYFRVRSTLRRRRSDLEDELAGPHGLRLRLRSREAVLGGVPLAVTQTQFAVLRELLWRRGQVVSADALSRAIWGHHTFDAPNYVEQHISRLRVKIEAAGVPRLIETVRGAGYVIR